MNRIHVVFAIAAAASTVTACSNTVVYVPRMRPAEINLANVPRIAVGGIGGEGGELITSELTPALIATKRFEVLDRQHLGEVMKEQDFGISGRVSDETAVSVGQMIGSGALLVGDVQRSEYKESTDKVETKCAKNGKSVPCTQYVRTASAALEVLLKVLDVETGKVLAAKVLNAAASDRAESYDDMPPKFNAKDAWLSSCRKQVVADFMKVIAPYQETLGVELLDDGDLPELEVGNNFAKLGKWNEAIGQYNTALARAEKDPEISMKVRAKALYNLGVGMAYSGRYDDGIAQIEQAYALQPEDLYFGQIARIKQFKSDDAMLAEQTAGRE